MRPQTVTLAVCRYSVSWFSVLSLNICLLFLGSVVSLSSGKVACSGKRRLRPLLSSHDAEEECAGDSLQYHIDEGQNERDRADVIKSLPCIGVLCRLTFPDWFHDEDPQTIHHEGHHRQQDHISKIIFTTYFKKQKSHGQDWRIQKSLEIMKNCLKGPCLQFLRFWGFHCPTCCFQCS